MDTIGTRIKQEREAQGLSRTALSKRSGVGYSTLAEIERGGMQTTTKARVIAEALGVNLKWLETGRGDPRAPTIESEPTSQPARIDPEILADAVKLVRQRFQVLGEDLETEDLELNAEPLALAYEYLAAVKAEGELAGNVVDFSKYLRAQGAKDEETMGGDGGIHRKGGGRAAR